ncbi:hypothetical protein D0441_09330 [Priestia megaterium]|nr:hypothetical protein D0441_09330 [Priestia megaterium]
MKNLFKFIFFLIGGVICLSILIFSIYTDLNHNSTYNPARIEKNLKRIDSFLYYSLLHKLFRPNNL